MAYSNIPERYRQILIDDEDVLIASEMSDTLYSKTANYSPSTSHGVEDLSKEEVLQKRLKALEDRLASVTADVSLLMACSDCLTTSRCWISPE